MFSSNCFVTLTPQNNAKLDLIKRHRKSLAPSVESLSNPSLDESACPRNKAFPQPEGLCPTQTIPIDSSMIYNYDNYRIIVIIVNITN